MCDRFALAHAEVEVRIKPRGAKRLLSPRVLLEERIESGYENFLSDAEVGRGVS